MQLAFQECLCSYYTPGEKTQEGTSNKKKKQAGWFGLCAENQF